jgi:hypothetical protein
LSGSRLNHELGDKFLDPAEANIRERESLLKKAGAAKIYGQAELQDSNRSAGPRMHYSDLIRRLEKICPVKVRDGSPGAVALYRAKKQYEYDPQEFDPNLNEFFWDHLYVGGFEKDYLPEYSHITVDTSELPMREIRGWRSVLIGLILNDVITVEAANQEFGDPRNDSRAWEPGRWFDQINQYEEKRNARKQWN